MRHDSGVNEVNGAAAEESDFRNEFEYGVAVSLVALGLVRNGYQVQKDIRYAPGRFVSVIAIKDTDSLAVHVRCVSNVDAVEVMSVPEGAVFGLPTYAAYMVGNEEPDHLVVSVGLKEKMVFSPERVNVEVLR